MVLEIFRTSGQLRFLLGFFAFGGPMGLENSVDACGSETHFLALLDLRDAAFVDGNLHRAEAQALNRPQDFLNDFRKLLLRDSLRH